MYLALPLSPEDAQVRAGPTGACCMVLFYANCRFTVHGLTAPHTGSPVNRRVDHVLYAVSDGETAVELLMI
jgi:hypothetical protein